MKILKIAAAITFALGAQMAHAADAKFGYGASDSHPQGMAAKRFAELVKTKTDGRVTVNTYGSGKLGSDPQMQSSVQGGTLEMMTGPTSNLVGSIKEFGIFDLPFIFSSYKEADAVLDGVVGKALLNKLDSLNLVGLSYQENGFRHITNSKRPIKKLEDIQGLKIRVIQNPVFIDTFKALGANPVPMPFTDLYNALESKAVDAQENPPGLIEASKFYEVQKYATLTGHIYSPFIVIASKKWFSTLSDADKKAVKDAATEAAVYQRKMSRDMAENIAGKVLPGFGMQVNTLSAEEQGRLREAVKPVVAKYSQTLGEDLMTQMQADIAKAR
jgi:tripartite ATP-independent transporter DctP family solute receptor